MEANDPRHGERRGYYAHRRAGQEACDACKRAASTAQARYDLDRIEGRPRVVTPHGTKRRLQGLYAIGWTWTAIAANLGISQSIVQKWAREPRKYMHATTAARVTEVYDRLSMTIPTGWPADRARAAAARHGYVKPLAWDEGTIDDPAAKPRGVRPNAARPHSTHDPVAVERVLAGDLTVQTSITERAEVCRRWIKAGRSLKALEAMTGWKTHRYYRINEEQEVA